MRYSELNQMLKGRNAQSKKWANNTYLHRRGDNIALQYHSTDVATFFPDEDVVLDNGGWFTSTTKERINWAIGNRLSQRNGVWYIDGDIRFENGITLKADGSLVGGEIDDKQTVKADRALKKQVKAFAHVCANAIPLDKPDGGDCWYCYMTTQNGDSLGDAFKDTDHLDSHIEDGYVVPSLVYKALEENYNAPMAFWQAFKGTGWDSDREFGKQAVAKAVYRYILKRKGYAL